MILRELTRSIIPESASPNCCVISEFPPLEKGSKIDLVTSMSQTLHMAYVIHLLKGLCMEALSSSYYTEGTGAQRGQVPYPESHN